MRTRFPLFLLGVAAVGGCAQGGDFPSLAPRPVERLSFEEPVRVDPPVAANSALIARAAALLSRVQAGDQRFEAAYARALPIVRAAGPGGSDSWVQAQEAISRTEAARVQSTVALAELDLLLVEQADEPTSAGDHAELQQVRAAAGRIVTSQQVRIDQLRRSVSPS